MSHIHGNLTLTLLALATLAVFAVCWFPSFAYSNQSITFGKIEIIDDVTDAYQVTGLKVYNQSTIYRSLMNMKDVPTGNFTKKTILAKYNAKKTKYDWMIDIDTGDEHFVPIFLPCCDQRSVIVVFPNCTNDVLPFHRRVQGDESPFTLMIKLDDLGEVVWNRTVNSTVPNTGGVVTTNAHNVCNGTDDIIYLAGPVNRTIPFDCAISNSNPDGNSIVSQFSHRGYCTWATSLSNATVTALECNYDPIYVTGNQDDGSFPSLFIAKLDTSNGARGGSFTIFNYNDAIPVGISVSDADLGSLYLMTPLSSSAYFEKQHFDKLTLYFESRETLFDKPSEISGMEYGVNETIYLIGSLFQHNSLTGSEIAFVAKLNTSDRNYDIIMVYNNVSSTGMAISVGNDGYVSALGRSESPLSLTYPSNRTLSSNSTFNFIVEILESPQLTCFGYDKSDSRVCSGRGKCEQDDICNCDDGYSGSNCQYLLCNGISSNDTTVCNGRGSCELNDICVCEQGYVGQNCEASSAALWLSANTIGDYLLDDSLILKATVEYAGIFPVNVYTHWILFDVVAGTQRIYNESYTLSSPIQLIQLNITDLTQLRQYNATATIQIENTTNMVSSETLSIWVPIRIEMKSLTVIPTSGAILYDHFLLVTNRTGGPRIMSYRFGYFDGNNRVFLTDWIRSTSGNLNTTLPILGNVTLFAQVLRLADGKIFEATTTVTVHKGESSKVTDVLTEQANNLFHTNGTQFEAQLPTYTNSLINSIQVISSNQTSHLLSNLINIVQSKQDELSATVQIETIRAISQQYLYLSEASTVQTSLILINSIQRNDSKISDSISVAHNLANVMISTNSSMIQRESFSSMVVVLTDKVRQNMTDGQTEEISFPNLETVISRLNSTSMDANTTVLVRHPSSSGTNTNTKFVQIVLNRDVLTDSNVSFVQGQVIANPPNQYSDKCNTSVVSPTVSTMLFTKNQQQVQSVDSSTPLSESSLVLPSISSLRNRSDDYQYACKYLNSENKKWLSDANICRTVTTSKSNTTSENVVVQCVCSQSVSHTVSLDYIQSSESVESGSTCSNPCECSSIERGNQPRRMKAYEIALIVLACLTLAIIIAVIVIVSIVVVKLLSKGQSKYELKKPNRAPTDEIEQRFDSMYD